MAEICFESTKMEIFYWEKALHTREKIRKNDFAPSEKITCYTPGKPAWKAWLFTLTLYYIKILRIYPVLMIKSK